MNLTQPLRKALVERPAALATVFGPRRRAYAQFADRVARLAAALRTLKLEPGDRIAMIALNSDRYIEYFYAAWWAGCVVAPINVRWTPEEIAFSLNDCGARALIVDDLFAPAAQALRKASPSLSVVIHAGEKPAPDDMLSFETLIADSEPALDAGAGGGDLAAIFYTGGTTGRAKGVMLTHDNLCVNAVSCIAGTTRMQEVVGVVPAPLFHVSGACLALQLVMRLGRVVVLPMFQEQAMLQAIQAERANETFMVPTMIKRLIEHPDFAAFDTSSLDLILYGASPIDGALLTRALAAFPKTRFIQLYGMTELSPVVTALPASDHAPEHADGRLRSAGRPLPSVEVAVVDEHGEPKPVGETGEIVARGPFLMAGYWNRAEETAAALRDGWMRTGDAGFFDSDGYLYIVDRVKDMIITGGENVYSAEVENIISLMPEVSMCAVIAAPDENWGERVHAMITLYPGQTLTAEDVVAHCRSRIAAYKCPRTVEFRAEMPLSAAGKILKHELRREYWRGRPRNVG